MSEQQADPAEEQVTDIPGMVGEPPAGDESPDDFVSNDQSAPTVDGEEDA